MKRNLMSLSAVALACTAVSACVGQSDVPAANEQVAESVESLVTAPIGPVFWPMAPISWSGTAATWPIAVYSTTPLDLLAFDIPGASALSLSLATLDGAAVTGYAPVPISSAWLDTFGAASWLGGLTPYYGMIPSMYGLDPFPIYGVPSYVYGAGYYPYVDGLFGGACSGGLCGSIGAPLIDGLTYPGLFPAGVLGTVAAPAAPSIAPLAASTAFLPGAPFAAPALSSRALMFSSFPAFSAATPFIVNVAFDGLTAASLTSLNIFTATAATNAAIQGGLALQATAFPILGVPLAL